MCFEWNGPREEVCDFSSGQNLTLQKAFETFNKGHSPSIGYASLSIANSTASRGESSLGPRPPLACHRSNDTDKNDECPHQFTTESSHISSLEMTQKCWDRQLTAFSEVSETERSEGSEIVKFFDAEVLLGSKADDAVSRVWSRVRAPLIQTGTIADRNESFTQPTVIKQDMGRRQVYRTLRVASVDSVLQGFQKERSRREACGIQREGPNDDLKRGQKVLEAWKRKSEIGFSVEINFVTKTVAGLDAPGQSLAEVHQVLQGIGLCCDLDVNDMEGPREVDNDDDHFSEQIIRELWLDLVHRAQSRRLLLVCPISHISLLNKALLRVSSSWLSNRISGLLVLDSSHWTPLYPEGRQACHLKIDISQRQKAFGAGGINSRSRQQTSYESCTLPLTRTVPQCIQTHVLPRATRTGLTNHSSPVVAWLPSLSYTLKLGRRERDIWCHVEEYQDCVSWSILDLLEGDTASCLAVNTNIHSPNAHEKLESQRFFSAYLEPDNFDREKAARASLILNALRWIAFSFQPLDFDELFVALASKPAGSTVSPSDVYRDKVMLKTTCDLVRLCLGLLRAGEKGFVEFCDPRVKNLVLQTESSFSNPCKAYKVHEMIATVCMDHLQCLHSQSMFRPWISTNTLLTEEVECCRLKRYSTAFWHEHFRIAHAESECLPSMFDEAIQSAITNRGARQSPIGPFQELRINLGLWVCCLHDFDNQGKTYLQMGADLRLLYPLNRNLLHIAAANVSPNMLKHLLEAAAESKILHAGWLHSFRHGSRSDSSDVISTLINHQAVVSNEDVADTNMSDCLCSAQVSNSSAAKFPSQAHAKSDPPTAGSEEFEFNTEIASSDTSCVHHLLEFGADWCRIGNVSDGLSQLEIGDGHSSTFGSPFQSEENALAASDFYQDDWLLVDEDHRSYVT